MSECEQLDIVCRIVNVYECIYNFFVRERKSIHSFNQILRGICVPQNIESYRPRTFPSGELYLVISITINKKLRRKDFAFTKAHCSFTEALLCVRLRWIQGCCRQRPCPQAAQNLVEKTNIGPMITQIMKCFTQNSILIVFTYRRHT